MKRPIFRGKLAVRFGKGHIFEPQNGGGWKMKDFPFQPKVVFSFLGCFYVGPLINFFGASAQSLWKGHKVHGLVFIVFDFLLLFCLVRVVSG